MNQKVLEKVRELIQPILSDSGVSLYELTTRKEGPDLVLSVLIDRIGGIDLDICVEVSEKISKVLDEEDPIREEYLLEVASPGAEKPLKTTEQLQASIDEYVCIVVKEPVETYNELVGYLRSVSEESITLEIKIKTRVKTVMISRDNIASAMTCVKL